MISNVVIYSKDGIRLNLKFNDNIKFNPKKNLEKIDLKCVDINDIISYIKNNFDVNDVFHDNFIIKFYNSKLKQKLSDICFDRLKNIPYFPHNVINQLFFYHRDFIINCLLKTAYLIQYSPHDLLIIIKTNNKSDIKKLFNDSSIGDDFYKYFCASREQFINRFKDKDADDVFCSYWFFLPKKTQELIVDNLGNEIAFQLRNLKNKYLIPKIKNNKYLMKTKLF